MHIMALRELRTDALEDLCTYEQLELLNSVDSLRSQGISHYVSLPQIIVCEDQSSSKSSVLEAICGVSFPIRSSLCTEKLANFLWSALRERPEDRESTTGLLNHPFLVGRRGGVPCWSQCLQRSRVVKQQLVKQRRNIKYVFVYREAMCLIYWISNSRIHDNKE